MPCRSCLPVSVTFPALRWEAVVNACMIASMMTNWGASPLDSVQMLYLGENKIKSLPTNIGQLKKLEELDLSGCKLGMLPDSICQCLALRQLWLSRNRFETVWEWSWCSHLMASSSICPFMLMQTYVPTSPDWWLAQPSRTTSEEQLLESVSFINCKASSLYFHG